MPAEIQTRAQPTSTSEKQTEHKIYLMSSEIANLWTAYMNDTAAICMLGTFLSHVEDKDIRSILEFALKLSKSHAQKLKSIFLEEQFPVPEGFSEAADTYSDAPRLYTDDFYLFYIQNLGKIGLEFYTFCLSNNARLDICEYFTECLNESAQLLYMTTEILLKKGTYIRSPYIPFPKNVEYVQKESYLSGWFGQRRPLNAIEISNIFFNMIQNQLGRTLLMGFSQVAKSQQIRDLFVRGRNISDKHVEIFGSLLSDEYLPSASAWDTLPTDSTIAPFSDKLMLFYATALNAEGTAHYGRSLSLSPRSDLTTIYVRLTSEIAHFTEDGATIMINNGWMEQPPHAPNREELAKRTN